MEFESYVANEETRALAVCVQLSGEIGRNVSVILSSTDLSAQGTGNLFLHSLESGKNVYALNRAISLPGSW